MGLHPVPRTPPPRRPLTRCFDTTAICNEAGQKDFPWFWTATTHIRDTDQGAGADAVYIAFGRAMGYMNNTWSDVPRGPGPSAATPKSGTRRIFPRAWAPRGDARRIYNFVRLVRDAEPSTDPGENTAGEPTAITISVNGAHSADVQAGERVMVSISLSPGEISGQTADWWMLRFYADSAQWFSYVVGEGWVSGFSAACQGPLVSFPAVPVFDGALSTGTHYFYFGFDFNPNGSPDPDSLAYEQARVTVDG